MARDYYDIVLRRGDEGHWGHRGYIYTCCYTHGGILKRRPNAVLALVNINICFCSKVCQGFYMGRLLIVLLALFLLSNSVALGADYKIKYETVEL